MTDVTAADVTIAVGASRGLWAEAVRRFLNHRLATLGLIMLAIIVLACMLAPLIAHYGPNDIDLRGRNQPPGGVHWLGSDGTGRDIFARILYGGRISLTVGFVAVAISAAIGIFIGCIAGYFGGKVDLLLTGVIDMVLTFPRLVIIIAFVAVVGPSIFNTMVVIGLLSWPSIARLTRGEILALRNQEFVLAARSLGTSPSVIILEHILPNVLGPILVAITLDVATVILLEASLSFLGLGAQAPAASWGNMLRDARTLSILESQPWMWIPPGAMIALAVLSINFVGDGLRDALDPQHIMGGGAK
ncbi:ABC transporter permease [Mesorhizobium sp. M0830]|uniref:oligopeptide ABC transporter permease n=1 Tax=Mesorhizobium sp. M0830 TaxID=2957008 RepID=UPI003339EA7A